MADDVPSLALLTALRGAVADVRHIGAGTRLVHCSSWRAPQAIIWHLGTGPGEGPSALLPLASGWDVPVLLVGRLVGPDLAALAAGLESLGAHHWLPDGAAAACADWVQALDFARAVHRRDQAQRRRITGLQEQLAQQRVLARAKGLLMEAQGISEDDAFALLRSAAMQARRPLGDMARAVVDSAVWSDAMNRAGQLRWLSQRCIAAAAQRLARIDPPAARRMQSAALRRAGAILDSLGRLPLPDSCRQALHATSEAWHGLKASLAERLDPACLKRADAAAERALAQAEALTGQLQTCTGSPILRVVNLCGRQRMRAQRLVKLGLLSHLGLCAPDPCPTGHCGDAAALVSEFGSTMATLTALPLGSAAIAAAHQHALDHWAAMVLALQAGEAAALLRSGEALLASVDALTRCWERSLHLVLD